MPNDLCDLGYHFQEMTRTLRHLRKEEGFTDLRFVCKKGKIVMAHQAVFLPLSNLMSKLFDISHKKQVGTRKF